MWSLYQVLMMTWRSEHIMEVCVVVVSGANDNMAR